MRNHRLILLAWRAMAIAIPAVIISAGFTWFFQSPSPSHQPQQPVASVVHGIGCTKDQVDSCQIRFNVKSIQPWDCHDPKVVLSDETQFVKVDLEVEAERVLAEGSKTALQLQNWAAEDRSGDQWWQLQVATECGKNTSVVLDKEIIPGTKLDSTLLVLLPKSATSLDWFDTQRQAPVRFAIPGS